MMSAFMLVNSVALRRSPRGAISGPCTNVERRPVGGNRLRRLW
jgi:hypothetical protein